MNTYQRVVKVIAESLSISPIIISPSSTMTALGADSLGLVELVMALEYEFDFGKDVEISEESSWLPGDITVQEIVDCVDRRSK